MSELKALLTARFRRRCEEADNYIVTDSLTLRKVEERYKFKTINPFLFFYKDDEEFTVFGLDEIISVIGGRPMAIYIGDGNFEYFYINKDRSPINDKSRFDLFYGLSLQVNGDEFPVWIPSEAIFPVANILNFYRDRKPLSRQHRD